MPTTYNFIRPAVKSGHNDPWSLLSELTAEREAAAWLEPSADVAQHFFSLVAGRRDQRERDMLIAKGLTTFWYKLADALREVDRHLLERMNNITRGGAA